MKPLFLNRLLLEVGLVRWSLMMVYTFFYIPFSIFCISFTKNF